MSFSRLLLLLGAATQVAGFAPVGLALRRVGSLNRHAAVHCGAVRQVNTAEFEEAIQDCETPILVDVFAVWCGPCQLMAPELDKVAEKFGDELRVLKIDADDEDEVASTLQIRGLPTVLLINDMAVKARMEGALMADDIEQLVNFHFFDGPKPKLEGMSSASS